METLILGSGAISDTRERYWRTQRAIQSETADVTQPVTIHGK
jgi:hypothetical protein